MKKKIDVYILTGYLGSGKTTLLQKMLGYLRSQDGEVVVIMNEMGPEDIDGEYIEGYGFPVKKMTDGCICCSIRGELTEALEEIVTRIQPAYILIETTGVADPIDVVDGLTHPELYDRLTLKGIVSVVDASRYLQLSSRFQSTSSLVKTIRNQVKYADLLLVNKTDLVSPNELQKVHRKLRQENQLAPLHETMQANIDLPTLLSVDRIAVLPKTQPETKTASVQKSISRFSPIAKLKQTLGGSADQSSLYNHIDSFSYQFRGPVDQRRFELFLMNLPKNVYRAKGFVSFHSQSDAYSFQQTETMVLVSPTPVESEKRVAVFIGEGMNQDEIRAQLEQCY